MRTGLAVVGVVAGIALVVVGLYVWMLANDFDNEPATKRFAAILIGGGVVGVAMAGGYLLSRRKPPPGGGGPPVAR